MKKWLSFLMALTLALGMTSFASAEQVETIEVAYNERRGAAGYGSGRIEPPSG